MQTPSPSGRADKPSPPSPMMLHGLMLLHRARAAAVELKFDPREFAVGLPLLIVAGVSIDDVRAMLNGGMASSDNPQLTAHSTLVLTPAGEEILRASMGRRRDTTGLVPKWDRDLRLLCYDNQIVKSYRGPAGCQETVLSAFEEDGWPARIDDPLPRTHEIDPKERLHDTVRRLNLSQQTRRLIFQRDGTGEGIIWKSLDGAGAAMLPPVSESFVRFSGADRDMQ